MARRMADIFCGGSKAALIAQLIETEELSREDIKELQRIARKKASN
jgi:predicted transcriptional regulator